MSAGIDRSGGDDAVVEIAVVVSRRHSSVARHGGEDAGLELRGVGDHEQPARVRDHRASNLVRQLQRSPPSDAHRPVTTPPGTYTGRNRPSFTQASIQFHPLALSSRDSFL